MSLAVIQAQTSLGTTAPSDLTGTIGVDITPPGNVPAGYSISLVGKLSNSSPGGYGMVFGYTVPGGKKVDPAATGSLKGDNDTFDHMKVAVGDDANPRVPNTQYWEVWFTEDAVNSNDWSTRVDLSLGGSTFTYTLTKKRTGDEL